MPPPEQLTLSADLLTPVSAYLLVAPGHPGTCLLESVEGSERLARYSILGLDPEFRFLITRDGARIEGDAPRVDEARLRREPLAVLGEILASRRMAPIPGVPELCGGAIGYAGFEFARLAEPKLKRRRKPAPPGHPLALTFFRNFLVFDHLHHEIRILARPADGSARARARARRDALALRDALARPPRGRAAAAPAPGRVRVTSSFSRAKFLAAVGRCKAEIRAGNAYQVVLSQQFRFPLRANPFALYRALRRINPSPYMYFLDLPEAAVVGASPEMLVRCENGRLDTVPIAGTRPRGADEASDRAIAAELLADPKELSEHRMLVDLGRNDLGRVAEHGSVAVPELMKVERYSHVMHLVSRVSATLAPGRGALDALQSVFPAGTLSGAPKFRALDLIDELEPVARGIYGGAILHLSPSGNLDSCIAIRTVTVKDGRAWGQAGAGIVYDSDPAAEYAECLHKFGALRRAAELAGG